MTRADEVVKKEIVEQLYWDSRVDASNVEVTVKNNKVTLAGDVPSYGARWAAEADAYFINDVKSVKNNLVIKQPPGYEIPTDEEIRQNIASALFWDSDIESSKVEVKVAKGWVTLEGSVDSHWKKQLTEQKVTRMRGVVGVTNQVTVVPSESVVDEIIADDIVSALKRNSQVIAEHVTPVVEEGAVTLKGQVRNWNEFFTAQQVASQTTGVKDVENNLVLNA